MTESEWFACAKPRQMLKFLGERISERKRFLFDCACCRRIWRLLTDERLRTAVEVVERYADGLATEEELTGVRESTRAVMIATKAAVYDANALVDEDPSLVNTRAHEIAEIAENATLAVAKLFSAGAPNALVDFVAARAVGDEAKLPHRNWRDAQAAVSPAMTAECAAQVNLLRDIAGNPFRPTTFDPRWQTWNHGAIPALARSLYEDRTFAQLPILADALEEAGCTDAEILNHCRQPSEHVRGCWVLDCLLGRE